MAIVGLALAALILHASRYMPFIADDALISLRYSQRLLDGHGLSWSDGEFVEGYSNLLWVLACAALGSTGLDLILAARIAGLASIAATMLAVMRAHSPASLAGAVPAVCGMTAIALCGAVAAWSIGGLEQPLVAALVAWGLVLALPALESEDLAGAGWRSWAPSGAMFALACWTRPDGLLFTFSACAGIVAARGPSSGSVVAALRLATLPAVATVVQLAFRLAYHGDWVPNSAHAKLGFSAKRLVEGLTYLRGSGLSVAFLGVPALVLAVAALWPWNGSASRRVRFLAVPLLVWSLYVAVVGGDIFPAWRHAVPSLVVLALLLAEGLAAAHPRPRLRAVSWAVMTVALPGLLFMQLRDKEVQRAISERWEWDGEVVGRLFRTSFASAQPLLAVDSAGTLPYFSGLPSIDLLGINDRWMGQHPPPDLGHGYLGHELGDGRYVLDRKPDLVVFCNPSGRGGLPCFRSGVEMTEDPRFAAKYRLIAFEGRDPRPFTTMAWVRAEDGRIGIVREPRRVTVPGFLLAGTQGGVARLDGSGRIGTTVSDQSSAHLPDFWLEEGRWLATLVGSGSPMFLRAADQTTGRPLAGGVGSVELLQGRNPIMLSLGVDPGAEAHVREIVLERLEATGSQSARR